MILALDTSTRSISLAFGDGDSLWQVTASGSQAASAAILEMLDHLLAISGHGREAISCLAIGSGPGSFTGLRVSFSIFRSLSMALDLPVLMISSLDALAAPFSALEELYILQRARKGYAYFARYHLGVRSGEIAYLTPEAVTEQLSSSKVGPFIAGDAAAGFVDFPATAVILDKRGAPSAGEIVRLALPLHEKKEYALFEELLPDYLHPSDAEEKAGI